MVTLNEEQLIPKTFLNIKGNEEEIRAIMFPKWLQISAFIFTIIVALMTSLTLYSYFNVNRLVSEAYDLEKIDSSREIDKLHARIRQLEDKP